MTRETYLLCFVAGLLGMAFHIFAVKVPGVKASAKVGNIHFDYGAFFQDELAAIIATVLMIFILLLVLNEIIAFKPEVEPYLKAGFVFIGYTGSSLLVSWLGKAQSKINSIVDAKTNVADTINPPIPPDTIKLQ